jgi:hypothetical protein
MGVELVLLYIGLAIAGAFSIDKGVDMYKHSKTINADKFNSCVQYADSIRECRGLE